METEKIAQLIFYILGGTASLIVVYYTRKIYDAKYKFSKLEEQISSKKLDSSKVEEQIAQKKLEAFKLEEQIAQKKLDVFSKESDSRINILDKTNEITSNISQKISENLINNPTWLDRFMDQTGVTYNASVYGKRIGHFYYEKAKIAKTALNNIDELLKNNHDMRLCLIIDSGTTMYPVFQEIASKIQNKQLKQIWQERVFIVTNNIPGIQYLMKTAKDDPSNEYSEVPINCYIMPGKPLSVYAAITGGEAEEWLTKERITQNLDVWKDGKILRIFGFVTGNYVARSEHKGQNTRQYFPVARGEGHVEIKRKIVDVSDEIYLLSPLMKFTFATVDQLNSVNDFFIERKDPKAKLKPNMVKYEEILIPENKPIRYFSTRRPPNSKFFVFSEELHNDLRQSTGPNSVFMNEFDIRYWAPEENSQLELEKEIPHTHLREQYERGKNIWNMGWVLENLSQ